MKKDNSNPTRDDFSLVRWQHNFIEAAKAVQGSHLDTKRIAATFRDFNLWLIKNHLAVTLAQVTSENIAAFHADLVQQDHSFDSAHRAKRTLIIFEAWLNQKRQFRSFPKS